MMRIKRPVMRFQILTLATIISAASAWSIRADVTGNPLFDGWTTYGNSLASGTYVFGSANYSYQTFGMGLLVEAGSNLEISDGLYSWDVGDHILAVGGILQAPGDLGWAVTGLSINSRLASVGGPKLQVKFGTSAATWSPSTIAPGSGNGSSGSGASGGRIQISTSGYMSLTSTPYAWDLNSGQLLVPTADHIVWSGGTLDERVARMIWNFDHDTGEVGSWELLLNVSLVNELNPDYQGLLPDFGDFAIMTVQDGDNAYTDALVAIMTIPEPTTTQLFVLILAPWVLRKLRAARPGSAA